jgi:hypothetical protein
MLCTPFKEVFYFMQTLPKLRGPSAFGVKKVTILHIFGLQEFIPGFIRAFSNFPNPFS